MSWFLIQLLILVAIVGTWLGENVLILDTTIDIGGQCGYLLGENVLILDTTIDIYGQFGYLLGENVLILDTTIQGK